MLRGISLRNLAKKVGVSPSFISQVEQNKCQPSLNTLRKISEALDITTTYLLESEAHEMTSPKEAVEIRLPNRLKYLSTIADFLKSVCQNHEVPTKDIENILLAVDEACTNIMKYAYQVGPLNYFKMRVSFDPDLVQIDLLDQGRRFNPLQNPPLSENKVAGGQEGLGMGIQVIKKMMDDIRYRYSPDEGNHLTLIKRISQSKENGV
ncbi:MAG: ATP-binding protein [Syntrophobacterales bacterium]|nr:MAG: ATP-binding protein [Syntrophobacterales bacterium]